MGSTFKDGRVFLLWQLELMRLCILRSIKAQTSLFLSDLEASHVFPKRNLSRLLHISAIIFLSEIRGKIGK